MIPRQCWRIHCSRPAGITCGLAMTAAWLLACVSSHIVFARLRSFGSVRVGVGKIGVDGGDFSSDACQHAGRQAGVWTGGRLTMQKPKLPRFGKTEESPDWRVESPVWRAEKRSAEE
jgi:hypothetical protein